MMVGPWSERISGLLRRQFVRAGASTIGVRLLSALMSLLATVFVCRHLGAELRGDFNLAISALTMGISFGCLGIHAVLGWQVAMDRSRIPAAIGNAIVVAAVSGLITAAILVFLSMRLDLIRLPWPLITLALCGVPSGIFVLFAGNILVSLGEVGLANRLTVIQALLATCSLCAPIFIGTKSVLIYIALVTLISTVTALVAWRLLRRTTLQPPRPDWLLLRSGLAYGFRSYVCALFGIAVTGMTAPWVDHAAGRVAVGNFGLAMLCLNMAAIIPTSLAALLMPWFVVEQNPARRGRMLGIAMAGTTLCYIGLVLLPAAVFGERLVAAVLGTGFVPAVDILLDLTWFGLAYALVSVLSAAYAADGIPLRIMVANLAGLLVLAACAAWHWNDASVSAIAWTMGAAMTVALIVLAAPFLQTISLILPTSTRKPNSSARPL